MYYLSADHKVSTSLFLMMWRSVLSLEHYAVGPYFVLNLGN